MKKFFSKFKNVYLDIYILLIISILFFLYVLIHINILNLKFLIPIILVLIILGIVNGFFLINKKIKEKIKKVFSVISVILMILFIVVSIVLLNVYSSVQKMFSTKSYVEYSVIVNKDSSYKELKDVDKKIIGFYQDDKYHEKAWKKIDKKIDAESIGYSTIEDLENALLDNDIDALLIMDSYLDVLNNDEDESTKEVDNNLKDFKSNTRTIYKFKIEVDNSKKSKDINLEEGSFAIFISGQDSFESTVSEASRSDVNMLATINLKTKQILLISIPRDYYITINGKGVNDKLTHISIYGSDTAANSLGDLLDVKVDYFVKFNFTTFMKAIDYFLPLDVYSDYAFTTGVYDQTIGNSYTFSQGYNHITSGEMALQFVRARKNFAEGDRQRGINQSRMLRAVINKASTPSILLKYNSILNSLRNTFLTNISDDSIIEIIKYILNHNGKFNISSYSLDGSDASRTCYSSGSQLLYVMIPKTETIEQAKIYIKDVLEGRTPDIEIDASELVDSSNSSNVNVTPYVEEYYYSSSNNINDDTDVNDNQITDTDDENKNDIDSNKDLNTDENLNQDDDTDSENTEDNNQENVDDKDIEDEDSTGDDLNSESDNENEKVSNNES